MHILLFGSLGFFAGFAMRWRGLAALLVVLAVAIGGSGALKGQLLAVTLIEGLIALCIVEVTYLVGAATDFAVAARGQPQKL